eukprot:TRINITY_DN10159_c0_g5_i1.p2 TRINITY_DN10159_c0_g5~~TRINITY_DN10159_c0_g5_i1.p2  ORF type:complete len:152 (-),score=0.99 TRINITY_DN10159_c0_g5_i1:161-580(-)
MEARDFCREKRYPMAIQGNSRSQLRLVVAEAPYFRRALFTVCTIRSVRPLASGWYREVSQGSIMAMVKSFWKAPSNSRPLSMTTSAGAPKCDKTRSRNTVAEKSTCLEGTAASSIHFEKCSIMTQTYFAPRAVFGNGPA